jgi:signal transduction histidine kinase
MSHEMRTPLNVIMGMNALVMDSDAPLSDDQREFSQQIRSASESLLVLINDILDLAKVPPTIPHVQNKDTGRGTE